MFADKVTLYLEEHGREDADRVKDVVHAALLAQKIKFNSEALVSILADRAIHREVIDELKEKLPDPPKRWKSQFEELCAQSRSALSMAEAMLILERTVEPVRTKAIALASEQPRKKASLR